MRLVHLSPSDVMEELMFECFPSVAIATKVGNTTFINHINSCLSTDISDEVHLPRKCRWEFFFFFF